MNPLTTVPAPTPGPDPDAAVVRRLRARARRQSDRVVRSTEARVRKLARRQRNDVRQGIRLRPAAQAGLRTPPPDRLLGPATALTGRTRVDALQQQVERERAAGHTWHDRLHGVVRWAPAVVVLADFA